MKNPERKPEDLARPPRKQGELHDDGVLESIGKAIASPIAGASEDDLLPPDEDTPPQRRSTPSSKRP